jgi:hypothetical protein
MALNPEGDRERIGPPQLLNDHTDADINAH